MNYQRFNRHEAYTPEIMDLVRETMNAVESYCFNNSQPMFNKLTNSLFGLYDGYLYDNLLDIAVEMNMPVGVLNNIKGIVKVTETYIALYGQSTTQI